MTTTTVGMSPVGPGAGGRCARGGFQVPSAECDREDETRRCAGLVLERRCTEPQDKKKVEKTQAAVPRWKVRVWRGG